MSYCGPLNCDFLSWDQLIDCPRLFDPRSRDTLIFAYKPEAVHPLKFENVVSSFSCVRKSFEGLNISPRAADILMSSWRPSTQKQYGLYIRQWLDFSRQRNNDHSTSPVGTVMEFLTFLFNRGLGYSSVNTARSALSCILYTDSGSPIGQHPLIIRFMKGVFEKRPALPRNMVICDTNIVLNHVKSLSPVKDFVSLKKLTFKTVRMATLLSAQRSQTIHLFSLDNMSVTPNLYNFRIVQPIKQTRPGRHLAEIELAAYPENPDLCIVTTMAEYIKRTEPLRGKQTALFISFFRPHKVVSRSTISLWVKTTLQHAGVDMNIFSPHSTRATSTSKANSSVSLETILKTPGWSGDSTFRRFYNKPIHTSEFSLSLVDSAANAH